MGPAVEIQVCPDYPLTAQCTGPWGQNEGLVFVPIAVVTAEVGVFAGTGSPAGSCVPQIYAVYQANLLPAGACVTVADSGGNTQLVPASAIQFGAGGAFTPPFDVSQLNSVELGEAFAAGFILIATAFVIGAPIRLLLNFIKGA